MVEAVASGQLVLISNDEKSDTPETENPAGLFAPREPLNGMDEDIVLFGKWRYTLKLVRSTVPILLRIKLIPPVELV